MHVLQCQHHLRRLPQQDAVSLGCSSTAVNCGQADLRNGRALYVRRTDWRLDDESESQQHFAVASTHSSNHLASGNRCAEHDWLCPRSLDGTKET